MTARLLDRGQRGIERLHGRLDQRRRLRGAALQPAQRRRQRRNRRATARHRIVCIAQIAHHLLDRHHGGPLLGERRFLVRLGAERLQFLDGVTQPIGLAPRALDLGAQRGQLGLPRAPFLPEPRDLLGVGVERAIGIEQRAVARHVDQRALVVLAVDLDQRGAERPQRLHAHRLIVDEGAGAAVGKLDAAQDQFVLGRDVVLLHEGAHRVRGRQFEGCRDLPLFGPLPHQGGVAARAERQARRHRAGSTSPPRSRR